MDLFSNLLFIKIYLRRLKKNRKSDFYEIFKKLDKLFYYGFEMSYFICKLNNYNKWICSKKDKYDVFKKRLRGRFKKNV